MLDPFNSLAFSVYENKGVFAVLLGSGVSRAAGVPTGWEIVVDLVRRVGALEEAGEQPDWVTWYGKRFGGEPGYSRLLDALTNSAEERRSILHRYIEPTAEDLREGRKVPTRAHRAIARLVLDGFVRVIVTTNFDRLLENSLRDEGVEPTVIKSDDDLVGAVPLTHSRCHVVKVHGDYLDTRIRNTESELAQYSAPMDALLDRIIDEHGLIVCGWSSDWDHALRAAVTRAPARRYPLYWASRGEPSEAARDLIRHRRGTILHIEDADTFFEGLGRKVDVQAATRRSDPRSLELIVAQAKSYLPRREQRIRLNDLVFEEVRRLRESLTESDLRPEGPWNPAAVAFRVARLEAMSEPLAGLFTVMGRWGDGLELPLVTDVLGNLTRKNELSGIAFYIELLGYPSVLAIYAYGLGALRAGRYDALRSLFAIPVRRDRGGEARPLVLRRFLWNWDGGREDGWRMLEAVGRSKTPLSDRLHEVLGKQIHGLTLDAEEFELLFDRFELIGSLAAAMHGHDEAYLTEVLDADNGRGYAEVPVGRAGPRSRNWLTLREELDRPDTRASLLKAGFFGGRASYLDVAMRNVERVAGRMRRSRC